jgi:hypothetical protein
MNIEEADILWSKITSGKAISKEESDSFILIDPEYIINKVKEDFSSVNNWFALAEGNQETLTALCVSYAMFIGVEKDRDFSEKEAVAIITEWLDLPYAMLLPSLYSKKFPVSVLLDKRTYSLLDARIEKDGSSSKASERKVELNRIITSVLEARESDVASYLREKLILTHGEDIKHMPDKWILKAFGAYSS